MINRTELKWLNNPLMLILGFVIMTILVLAVSATILVNIMLGIIEALGRTLSLGLKNTTTTNNALLATTIFLAISLITALT
jgi:hypothetical protein